MFKTKVGYSTNVDAYKSGVETATKANKVGNVKLGMLFTSCDMDQKKIVEGVKSVLGNKPIIGCTSSSGIVVPDGLLQGDAYSGMMAFADDDLIVGVAGSEAGKNPREIGKKIAREAITNAGIKKVPSYFYMVASPKEEEEYLKGIEDVIGTVPFFGGSAADNTVEGKWSIICNDKIFQDGCAVAFFYAKNECKNIYTGAYRETDNVGIITEVRNHRTLAKIDGVGALKKYGEWIGKSTDELKGSNLLVESITKPLGIKDPLGSLTVIRHPMFGDDMNTADNSDDVMNLGNNLVEKTAVIQMEATVDELIKSNSDTLKALNTSMKKEAKSYFLVHCGGRKLGIGDRANEIYEEVKKVAGDKEFLMIFTFGEYGSYDHSANICGGLMLSFTGFSE